MIRKSAASRSATSPWELVKNANSLASRPTEAEMLGMEPGSLCFNVFPMFLMPATGRRKHLNYVNRCKYFCNRIKELLSWCLVVSQCDLENGKYPSFIM